MILGTIFEVNVASLIAGLGIGGIALALAAKESIEKDLQKILDLVEKLEEVNVDGVEPLIYMTDEKNVLRKDVVKDMVTKEEALQNAPQRDSDYFKVPKVIKK